jgi:hypothetical protein
MYDYILNYTYVCKAKGENNLEICRARLHVNYLKIKENFLAE